MKRRPAGIWAGRAPLFSHREEGDGTVLALWKRILTLALPSIATFSSMTFTGMLTLVIVGRLGAAAITVVGISNIIMYNTWALFAGINEAVNYLVAQNYGEGTMREGNERMQAALWLSLGCSALVLLGSLALPAHIFAWMGANAQLVRDGAPYLQARMWAFAFSILSNVYFAYMRAVGDTKTPMYISLGTNVLLVTLTYGWTYGRFGLPQGGLTAAGLSMVVSEGIGFLLCLAVHYGLYHRRFATRAWYAVSPSQMAVVGRESVKLSAMELAMSLGMLVFTACITSLGTAAVAANEIALNILSLGFMPANGFGMAATIAVGQELGAGRPLVARRVGLHTVGLGVAFMALFSVFLLVCAGPVARIYTSDPKVVALAVGLIHLASAVQLFDGGGIIFGGGLRGVGDTTYLFRISALLNWLVFVPLTIVLTRFLHLGQTGAWVALCTLIVLMCFANGARYVWLRWEALLTVSAAQAGRDRRAAREDVLTPG
ncbi:MATE efflux family protein [Alicyclobacillus cellulosilyticus]|uniref:Probable multidrug resistance protein NorM n=1 Tax=Alicyclobacillus cellulosilyticus TaxID=1003997 RepID=A0A917K3P0_9BACL|nr:MATE family efflux transporter [Alicyclobacillus cellulosilyticus]GGI99887.1 MATE efflux family protein [Alicyclobacillus cellulosilyticus]